MISFLLIPYLLLLCWAIWRRRSLLPDVLAVGLLGLLTLAFFWRLVAGDAFMPADGGDLGSFLYPLYSFIQNSLKTGVWPLWNPHLYGGTPFVAEVQSGILYPPHLLRFLLGPELRYADMQWLSMLHIWWAGVTTYFLIRGIGLARLPGLLGAVAFMFSDLFIVHFGNLNLIAVASWLPLGLLGVHQTLARGGVRPALGAGLALGVGALAGHVQMTLYSLMAVAIWGGLWLLLHRAQAKEVWQRVVLAVAVPAALTVALAAPLLLPGFEMADLTTRSAWRYAESVQYSLSPAQLIGMLIPGFFGRSPQLFWGLWPRVEVGYAGVLTLALALVGITMRPSRRTWLGVGLAAAALAFSLGIYASVHGWLTWLLPGLSQLRAPARFIFVFDLALALLAAQGLQALCERWSDADRSAFNLAWRPLRALLLIGLGVGAPVIYAVLLLTQTGDPTLHLRASVSAIAVVTFLVFLVASLGLLLARRQEWVRPDLLAVLAVALLFIDLSSLGGSNDLSETDPTLTYQRPALVAFLRSDPDLFRIDPRTGIDALWQPQAALLHGLDDVWGVANPLVLANYAAYLESTGSRSTDLYALLNVKYVLGRKDVVLDWNVWELAFDGDPDLNVYRNRRFQPRVQLLGSATIMGDLAAAQAAVRAPDFRPLDAVVVEEGVEMAGSPGQATITFWTANQVMIQTESADPSTLLVTQSWYPGWMARLDGGDWQPVLRANGAFQAVQLPAGKHEVVLRFQARSFSLGLLVSALSLLATAIAWRRWR